MNIKSIHLNLNAPPINTNEISDQFDEHFGLEFEGIDLGDAHELFGEHDLNLEEELPQLEQSVTVEERLVAQYFSDVSMNFPVSDECEQYIRGFKQRSIDAVYDHLNKQIFHRHLKDLRNLQKWIEEFVPSAWGFRVTHRTNHQGIIDFTEFKMAYDDGRPPISPLVVPSKFSNFVYNLISLWNTKIWIFGGGNPILFHTIVATLKENIDFLDENCPIFFKFYQSLVLYKSEHQISGEQFQILDKYLNVVWRSIHDYLPVLLDQYKKIPRFMGLAHLIGNMLTILPLATEFKYCKVDENIECHFILRRKRDEPETIERSFNTWSWKFMPVIKIMMIIYNTRLYVRVFHEYVNDFDPAQDLFDCFKMVCKKVMEN